MLFIIQYFVNGIYYRLNVAYYFLALYGIVQEESVSDKLPGLYFQGTCFKSWSVYRLLWSLSFLILLGPFRKMEVLELKLG